MKALAIFGCLLASAVSLRAATTLSDVNLSQDAASGMVTVSYVTTGDPAIVTCDFLSDGVSLGAYIAYYDYLFDSTAREGAKAYEATGAYSDSYNFVTGLALAVAF